MLVGKRFVGILAEKVAVGMRVEEEEVGKLVVEELVDNLVEVLGVGKPDQIHSRDMLFGQEQARVRNYSWCEGPVQQLSWGRGPDTRRIEHCWLHLGDQRLEVGSCCYSAI